MNTILSIVSSLGVVSTAVLSGMATYDAVKAINEKKAETKKEKIKVEIKIFRVKWDQEKGDFELDGAHEQGIPEPRGIDLAELIGTTVFNERATSTTV